MPGLENKMNLCKNCIFCPKITIDQRKIPLNRLEKFFTF
jgi:hypothetical protein